MISESDAVPYPSTLSLAVLGMGGGVIVALISLVGVLAVQLVPGRIAATRPRPRRALTIEYSVNE